MSKQNYTTVVVSGPMSPEWPKCMANWNAGVSTNRRLTTYYVRSWPKGRMSAPLRPNEVRMTSVCMLEKQPHLITVSIVLTFLVDCDLRPNGALNVGQRHTKSTPYIPLFYPIDVSNHATKAPHDSNVARDNAGNKMIFVSTVRVLHDDYTESIRPGSHDFVIAGMLAGSAMPDRPRRLYETTSKANYDNVQAMLLSNLSGSMPSDATSHSASEAAHYLKQSRVACGMLSPSGLLDIICSPIAHGALPDGMQHPMCIPLVLALTTRIAARPSQYELRPGTPNDTYASKELASLMESVYNPIMRVGGDNLWAIDICATFALTQVRTEIRSMRKRSDRDREELHVVSNLLCLLSMGYALCNDVMGATLPKDVCGEMGCSSLIPGPIERARCNAMETLGMGAVGSDLSTLRVSPRANRQDALVKLLCGVEEFLRSGSYNKLQLFPFQRPVAQQLSEDHNGFPHIASMEADDVEQAFESKTCREAFLHSKLQIQRIIDKGIGFINTFSLKTYIASKHTTIRCASCTQDVDIYTGVVFARTSSRCSRCKATCCFKCSAAIRFNETYTCTSCRA